MPLFLETISISDRILVHSRSQSPSFLGHVVLLRRVALGTRMILVLNFEKLHPRRWLDSNRSSFLANETPLLVFEANEQARKVVDNNIALV